MNVGKHELLNIIHDFTVILDLTGISGTLFYLLWEKTAIKVYYYLVLWLNELTLVSIDLLLLGPKLILLDVPLEVLVDLVHGITPPQAETEDHMVDILVKCLIHIIVEELHRNQFEHLLVVLPILKLFLLNIIPRNVRLILNKIYQCRNHLKYHKHYRKPVKPHFCWWVLANEQNISQK